MDFFQFPSISKAIPEFYSNRSDMLQFDLEHGRYAVGDLCVVERLEGVRTINAGPADANWRAVFNSSVLKSGFNECCVVMGAPKSKLLEFKTKFNVPFVVKGKDVKGENKEITIKDIRIIPEATGHSLAFQSALQEEVLVVSIGFGTIEAGAANDQGIISSTLVSFDLGTQVVAQDVMSQILTNGAVVPVGKGRLHYFDDVVRDVHDGKKRDFPLRSSQGILKSDTVHEMVFNALETYAETIQVTLRAYLNKYRDRKFKLILTGGGMLYLPVRKKLEELATNDNYSLIEISEESRVKSAAVGYRIVGEKLFPEDNLIALDLGNHTTIGFYKEAQIKLN
ncbi:hypothetical protein [Silvanigrella aquatica]|uniref:Actin-like protein N-terminal domain-containing protein n=1 Tax=Silvanigrella aquatica TaxID=1915309 RepID=A0A1L4D4Y2_9BACT|nr:hypothetical protein [Silvanigrella aquatica]APJ05240.1 hypothetical protein AXG55_14555 [Silvanigrella aquatica]